MIPNIIELLNKNKFDQLKDKLLRLDKINDYLLQDNNFIHICAIRGVPELLNYIQDKKIDKYKSNRIGENILHLLLKNGWDELAINLIKKDDKFLDYTNMLFQYPINYCIDRLDTFNFIIDIIYKKYPYQINIVDTRNKNIISYILDKIKNNKDDEYFKIIKNISEKIDFNLPEEHPILIQAILKKLLLLSNYLIDNNYGINISNKLQLYPIHAIIETYEYDLLQKILNNKNFDKKILNTGGLRNEFLPLILCLKSLLKFKKDKNKTLLITRIIKLLLKHIDNFNVIDENRNNYAHYIVNLIEIKHIKIDKKIVEKILKKSNLNSKNIIGITANNIQRNKISDKCILSKNNIIVFPEINKNKSSGLFVSDILHNMIYTIYLLNKYNDLTIPIITKDLSYKENILKKLNMQEINYCLEYNIMRDILLFGYDVFYNMMSYIILWKDKHLYWMDENLEESLNICLKNKNHRYILIKVTILTKNNTLHANIILFDKHNNSFRRFEPYGNLIITDELVLDKKIMDIFNKLTHKKIKYYKPSDYLEEGRFQSISNDGSSEVRKVGDPMGFCLAWCFWYVEIRVKNPNLEEKELIKLAAEKIFSNYCNSTTPYNDFIRDYGRMLNNQKDLYFNKFDINKNNFYDVIYKNDTLDKISFNILNELEELKLL
jgi:hypothetical protein